MSGRGGLAAGCNNQTHQATMKRIGQALATFRRGRRQIGEHGKNLELLRPGPTHRITIDSEGNQAVYLELAKPQPKEFSVIEAFTLSRREQISGVDARNARPLSADKRAELAPFLAANHHVILDDRIRKLAAEIVGSEKDPVLAARKLYDWELANIDDLSATSPI